MTKEELKQKAKDWCKSKNLTPSNVGYFTSDYCEQSYIAGATENGIQWHDLRKDPNDLPKPNWKNWVVAVYDGGRLWCRARREECVDGIYWVNSFHHTIENVVLWAKIEIPL